MKASIRMRKIQICLLIFVFCGVSLFSQEISNLDVEVELFPEKGLIKASSDICGLINEEAKELQLFFSRDFEILNYETTPASRLERISLKEARKKNCSSNIFKIIFDEKVAPGEIFKLRISYKGKIAVGERYHYTDYIGKIPSKNPEWIAFFTGRCLWHPVFHGKRPNGTLRVISNHKFLVVSSGKLSEVKPFEENKQEHIFKFSNSPKWFELAACNAWEHKCFKKGLPVDFYFSSNNMDLPEEFYQKIQEIINSLSYYFGDFPQEKLKIVELPIYAGSHPNGSMLLIARYMIQGKRFGTLAHELGHFWFGGLVRRFEGRGRQWLWEGFAQASRYLWLLDNNPRELSEYLEKQIETFKKSAKDGEDKSILYFKEYGSYQVMYVKGGLAILWLRAVLGKSTFARMMKDYVKTYSQKPASIQAFLNVLKKYSNSEQSKFFEDIWLKGQGLSKKAIAEIYACCCKTF